MSKKPTTFDNYLAALADDQRAALEKLRKTIRAAAPEAEEGISYGLAAFRLNGKPLVALGATANHCAFYLMSGSMVDTLHAELQSYDTSKGTIRFAAKRPLPAALVKLLVKARIAENAALAKPSGKRQSSPTTKRTDEDVEGVLASLRKLATKKTLAGMARYAIPADKALGVTVADLRQLAKKLGQNHALAAELWGTDIYEARMLAAFVDDPQQVTPAQMESWCRDFDSWAICDTVCFALFDRTSHAWKKIAPWARKREEFSKRAAFALLWGLSVHDKAAEDERFLSGLALIERAATDERNFVKKAVNMALRAIGKRNATLHAAALAVAERLADSEDATARWVGKDALRELAGSSVAKRLAKAKNNRSA